MKDINKKIIIENLLNLRKELNDEINNIKEREDVHWTDTGYLDATRDAIRKLDRKLFKMEQKIDWFEVDTELYNHD